VLSQRVEGRTPREREPFGLGHCQLDAFALEKVHRLGDRLAVRLDLGFLLPNVDEAVEDLVERRVDRDATSRFVFGVGLRDE